MLLGINQNGRGGGGGMFNIILVNIRRDEIHFGNFCVKPKNISAKGGSKMCNTMFWGRQANFCCNKTCYCESHEVNAISQFYMLIKKFVNKMLNQPYVLSSVF